jgi:hypothetical protein
LFALSYFPFTISGLLYQVIFLDGGGGGGDALFFLYFLYLFTIQLTFLP